MVQKVVEDKIVKLSIDDSSLQKGLANALKGFGKFNDAAKNIKTDIFEKAGDKTQSLGDKIANTASKIPLLGGLVDKLRDIGGSSDSSSKSLDGMSGGIGGLVSRIPVIGSVAGSILGIGSSATKASLQVADLGSGSSFNGLNGSAESASSSVMEIGNAAEQSAGKFGILANAASVALGGVIYDLGSKAIGMFNKWTFAPITEGFGEYERELESTRVLTSALGEDHKDQITSSMRMLEQYAKTTRYNSQQMNSSLAQFVNAGVDIDKAALALKGWGNLAASSAASTNQFNTSLQFGIQQALAMGYMNKQNWNSVENAQMGTIKFKQQLVDVGKEMGTVTDEMLNKYNGLQGMFTDALAKEQWLDNDVLMEALRRYAEDDSMNKAASQLYTFKEAVEATEESVNDAWSKVWLNILGSGDDAAAIWTPIGEGMSAVATAIPSFIEQVTKVFNAIGGRKALMEGFGDALKFISDTIIKTNIGQAWNDVFPINKIRKYKDIIQADFEGQANGVTGSIALIGEGVTKVAEIIKDKLRLDPAVATSFRSIATTILNVLGLIAKAAVVAAQVLEILIPDNLIQNGIIIVGIFSALVNGITNFFKALVGNASFKPVIEAFDHLRQAVSGFYDVITRVLGFIQESLEKWSRHTGDVIEKTSSKFKVWDAVAFVINAVAKAIEWLTNVIFGLGQTIAHSGAFEMIANFTSTVGKSLSSFFQGTGEHIGSSISSAFSKTKKSLGDLSDSLFDKGKKSGHGFSKGVADGVNQGKASVDKNVGELRKNLESNSGAIKESGKKAGNSFADGVKSGFGKIGGALNNINPFRATKVGADELTESTSRMSKSMSSSSNSARQLDSELSKTSKTTKDISGNVELLTNKHINLGKNAKIVREYTDDTAKSQRRAAIEALTYDNAMSLLSFSFKKNVDSIGQLRGTWKTIKDFTGLFTEWAGIKIGNVTNFEALKHGLQGIATSGEEAHSKMYELGDILREKFGINYSELTKRLTETGQTMKDSFKDIPGTFKKVAKSLKEVDLSSKAASIKSSFGIIGDFFEGLTKKVETFSKPLGMIFKEIGNLFKSIALGADIQTINQILQSLVLWKILKKIDSGGSILDKFGDKIKNLKELLMPWTKEKSWLSSLKDTLKSYNRGVNAKAIKDIATALLILSGAMFVMSLIPGDKVAQVMGLMITAALSFAIVYGILKKLQGPAEAAKEKFSFTVLLDNLGFPELKSLLKKMGTATMILSLATSVMMIGKFMLDISKLSWEEIGKGMVAAGIAMFELAIAAKMAGKGATLGDAGKILALAFAIKMIVNLIKVLNKMSSSDVDDGLFKIGKIALLLSTAVALMSGGIGVGGISIKWGQGKFGTAVTMLALVMSIKMMIGAIEDIASIKTESLYKGLFVIKELAKVITTCIAFMSGEISIPGVGGIKWGNAKMSTAFTLIALVLSIKMLAGTVESLGKMDVGVLLKGSTVVEALSYTLALCVSLMGFKFQAGGVKISTAPSLKSIVLMISIVGGIMLLAGTVAKLGELEGGVLLKGLLAITTIGVVIGGLMFFIDKYAGLELKDTAGLVVAVGGIMLLGGTVMRLGQLPIENLMLGLTAIGVIGLAIAGVIYASSKFTTFKGMAGMLIAVAGIYTLAEEIMKIAAIPADGLQRAEIALGVMVLAVGAMMLLSKIDMSLTGILNLVVAAGTILVLAFAIEKLANIGGGDMTKVILAIAAALTVLIAAGAALLYSGAGEGLLMLGGAMALAGVGMLAFGAGCKLVVEALKMLYDFVKEVLGDLGSLIGNIGSFLGDAFSDLPGFFSGLWDGITSGFSNFFSGVGKWGSDIGKSIGDGLGSAGSWIGEKAGDGWNAVKGVWDGGVQAAGDIGSKVGKFFGDGIDGTKETAKNIGQGLWNGVKDIWDKAKSTSSDLGKGAGNAFSKGVEGAKSLASSAGDKLRGALKDALSNVGGLWDSGNALISRWGEGITHAFSNIKKTVSGWISKIRGLFPNSPAKEGPLSGQGWIRLRASGSAFMERWGEGIGAGASDVHQQVIDTISDIKGTLGILMDETFDPTITPVIKPEIDKSNLDDFNLDDLLPNGDTFDPTRSLNPMSFNATLAAQNNTKYNIDNLVEYMQNLTDKVDNLINETSMQSDILSSKSTDVYLDGTIVNKKLAPGMQMAQDSYNQLRSRMGGVNFVIE